MSHVIWVTWPASRRKSLMTRLSVNFSTIKGSPPLNSVSIKLYGFCLIIFLHHFFVFYCSNYFYIEKIKTQNFNPHATNLSKTRQTYLFIFYLKVEGKPPRDVTYFLDLSSSIGFWLRLEKDLNLGEVLLSFFRLDVQSSLICLSTG